MPTRDKQHQVRERQAIRQPRGQRMASKVIDPQQRFATARRNAFGAHHARDHATNQPRPGGHRDRIDLVQIRFRVAQRGFDHKVELLCMCAGGNLGDDASEIGMQFCLPKNSVAEDFGAQIGPLAHHGCGGVVAAAFDAEHGDGLGQGGSRCCAVGEGQVTPRYGLDNAPPFMKRVLLTRPAAQSRAFAAALQARFGPGLDVIESPLLRIDMLSPAVDFSRYDGLVFTSQNGVAAFAHLHGPSGMTAFCVGERTADAAREAGLLAVSANGDVEALNALLAREATGQRLLHLRGAHVAGMLRGEVEALVAYEQRPVALSDVARAAISDQEPMAVPLFSPRTARHFAAQFDGERRENLHLVCLSTAVAALAQGQNFGSVTICDLPTAAAMMARLDGLLGQRPA